MGLDEDDMTTPTRTPLQPAGNKRKRLISQAVPPGKGNKAQRKGASSATLGSASSAPPKQQMKGAWSTIFARDEEKILLISVLSCVDVKGNQGARGSNPAKK